jgi:hypothetical protein
VAGGFARTKLHRLRGDTGTGEPDLDRLDFISGRFGASRSSAELER